MMTRNTIGRALLWTVFVVYCGIMLWLLFGRDSHYSGDDYLKSVRHNINLIPFHTNLDLVRNLICPPSPGLYTHAWINLFGNVVVFIPLGIFLPLLWTKLRRWTRFFLYSSGIIVTIELLQLFTLRGIFDVDDYILNMAGLFVGFAAFFALERALSRISARF